jgi:hypothetical protein
MSNETVPELPDDWWSSEDVATYLDVKTSSVRAYVARGQMPPPDRLIGQRKIRLWKPETIKTWHESRPRQPATAGSDSKKDA